MRRDLWIIFFLLILIILLYQLHDADSSLRTESLVLLNNEKFKIQTNEYSSIWYKKNCFKIKFSEKLVLEKFPEYLNNTRLSTNEICRLVFSTFQIFEKKKIFFFCREFLTKFHALFRLDEIYGLLKLSPVYLNKVNKWLHNNEILLKQIRKQVNYIRIK
jgi:hypothetical protein